MNFQVFGGLLRDFKNYFEFKASQIQIQKEEDYKTY